MGSNKYFDCANKILQFIGGNENVASAAHCATRLRLVVKDESLINKEEIENLDLVKGAFMNGGQFQVIIGQGIVNKVYAEFANITGIKEMSTADVKAEGAKKLNPLQRLAKVLSDIFVPIIPAIVAAGLLMGLLGLAGKFGLEQYSNTWWWMMLDWFSSAAFNFLPILVAISAAKVFGCNPYLAATVGGIMIHPALQNAWTQGTGYETIKVLGLIDMPLLGYQGTVLPILIVIFVMSYIEKGTRKIVPELLDILLTPLITVLVTGFLALAVIGPAANFIGAGISTFLTFAIDKLGIIAGLLFGGAYSSIVITGIHHSFHAVELSVLAETGVNTLLPIWSMANVAQGGACFAAFLLTKNKKMKAIALPSAISTLFGITEAAIFGVNLRYKTPFIGAAIGGAIGGAYVVAMKVGMTAVGVTGIPGMAITASGSTLHYIIGLVIAVGVAFVATMFMGIKEEA
ncbi:PTS transporter subunit EIIC [Clostridium sp. NSJ-49]|uniref:sucrose-specific PTS transporter subunit IIBC n=1 Tax=Clostridium TaxID=1485 RepID=UPI00164C69A0|nr:MULTISPECIES: sucrose-specific PTS transporter subunit IIBC [unclassified Clostridium]MBC5625330.1 PTS transporter subunit EIIC [Clostridium sp. NSJ-49]MCD2501441.1 sucrose-specific PTS transporter subunit IIBC [Clostridium sp. NSJ-145]